MLESTVVLLNGVKRELNYFSKKLVLISIQIS
jgi:hypothetical protein